MPIRVRELSHIYMRGTPIETTALRNINLDVDSGSSVGICGRSGSGKSTLAQHLNGLLKPATGTISVDGIDVTPANHGELRRRIGMVFQQPERQLFEESVYGEIAAGLSRSGMSRREIDSRVAETLHLVGLGEGLLERSPFTLSGGEKRRVAIAAVLARRPEILVLDEPAAALDPRGRREMLDSIAGMRRALGFTLLLVSNSLEDVVRLVDRVVILENGAVAMDGSAREVLRNAEALEQAGMTVPLVTAFMMRLRSYMPEMNDCILTAEEARDEVMRVLAQRGAPR